MFDRTLIVRLCALTAGGLFSSYAGTEDTAFSHREKNHWAFQPLEEALPPLVQESEWARNPIDAFISAKLEEAGVTPAPPATHRALIPQGHVQPHGAPAGS